MHPQLNYKFTFVSGDSADEFSGESDFKESLSMYSVLQGRSFCSKFSSLETANVFNLQYTGCRSNKKCLPLGGVIMDLPGSMSLEVINCTEVRKRVRIFLYFEDNIKFSSLYHRFNPNTTLIGEEYGMIRRISCMFCFAGFSTLQTLGLMPVLEIAQQG
ncbi:hypothetical protein V6N13_049775 [Hibiscus sabdariffa]|uniref:Uncharacterized protein n=1 Tax=Hibiscus sabdariffa TaxID=183260 RepID=A0ABR2QW82_9ROSI